MMRVIFVANTAAIGGSELYLINLATSLLDMECRVFMPRSAATEDFKSRAKTAVVDTLPTNGYSVHPRAFIKAAAFYRGLRTDILHFNLANPSASSVDILAAKLFCRAPIVATTHAPYVSRTRRELATARAAVTLADRVIVVCEESRRHVYAYGAKVHKVTTIYNGAPDHVTPEVRLSEIRQEFGVADPASILLGTVARLEQPKGLDILLRAFRAVAEQAPNTRLCIVGDGSQGDYLKALAAELGIAVVFTPWTSSYLDQMAAFDVFVLPSLFESFPFAIVEAMMAAKPVVATDVGGVSEAVSQGVTGLLVKPGDSDKMAESILALVSSQELRTRMGKEARTVALREFSGEMMAHKTREVYEQLVAARGGPRCK